MQRPGWARDGWTPPPRAGCQGMRSFPFLPASLSLPSYTRSDPSMRGAMIKRRMGSEKLEERERSSVAAKHPQSRLCYDAKIPSGAQLSVVCAQIRQGEGGGLCEGTLSGVETLHLQVALPPLHPTLWSVSKTLPAPALRPPRTFHSL